MTPKEIASIDGILNKKNVVSISTGIKQVGGIYTNEQCAVVGVISKKPLDDLDANDIVPSVLSDGSTKTDIVAIGEIVPHGSCPTNTGAACSEHDTLDNSIVGGMQIYSQKYSLDNTLWTSYGTLGAIVRDNDGTLVGLTNNHVTGPTYYENIGYQWGVGPGDVDQNTHKEGNQSCLFPEGSATTYARQIHYGSSTGNSIILGTVKRVVPIIFNNPNTSHAANYCDAALINLSDAKISNIYPSPIILDSTSVTNYSNTAPIFDFSNLGDINNTNICIKVGRTTGRTVQKHDVTLYDPASGQFAAVTSTDSDINVNFINCVGYAGTTEGIGSFRNTIAIKYQNAASDWRFSYSGDSGSLCWIWNNGRWEVLGLIFAGGCDNDNKNCTSFVCRIDYILKQLNIGEGWTNDPTVGSDTQSLFNYIGTTASTTLTDVSACTNLWNGDIILPTSFTDTTFQLEGNSQECTICYNRVSSAPASASISHTSTGLLYNNSTSATCGSAFNVDIVSVPAGTVTVDPAAPGASNVYTINGVSAAKLKLKRNKQYLFKLNNPLLYSGALHAFQIKDNHFNNGTTYGPVSNSAFYFTAGTNTASDGYMNYVCVNHGPNMGNFIFFED